MNIKNAKYKNTENTIIDVEIEHPQYGWIPYTFNSETEDKSFDEIIRVWLDSNTPKPYVIDLDSEKINKANEIKKACTAYNPVSLDISLNGENKTIVFNGGDESANSIKGGIDLAKELGETTVILWDYNNKLHSGISFEIALSISKAIGKKWRNDMYKRQTLLNQIEECTTIEQLNQISW